MKRIAILQSSYIPWKGYFDLINAVDEFVFFDTAQYTKNDWRNRNKIKTSQGVQWLSVPCVQKCLEQSILETKIKDLKWARKHWKSLFQNYSKSKFFDMYRSNFENCYLNFDLTDLSSVNYFFIKTINEILGIETKLTWSHEYELVEGKTKKLLSICEQAGAEVYVSGPSAKDYFDIKLAEEKGIHIEWMDYSGYPEYRQLHGPFEHGVTVLDLIFNEGPNAKKYMKSFS